jgi:hypothetical protein
MRKKGYSSGGFADAFTGGIDTGMRLANAVAGRDKKPTSGVDERSMKKRKDDTEASPETDGIYRRGGRVAAKVVAKTRTKR